jgi:hypothetical protein
MQIQTRYQAVAATIAIEDSLYSGPATNARVACALLATAAVAR